MTDLSIMKYTGMAVFGLVAIILLLLAYAELSDTRAWISYAMKAEGKVVQLEERTEMERYSARPAKDQVHPTTTVIVSIEFSYLGQLYHLQESSYLFRWFYAVGDPVTVLFDPDDPAAGHLDHPLVLWGVTAALFVLGLGFGAGAILVLRLMP